MFSSGDAPPPGPPARRRPGRPKRSGTPDQLKQLSILEGPAGARGGEAEAQLSEAPVAEAESVESPAGEAEPG
jgi:hypothetical protein